METKFTRSCVWYVDIISSRPIYPFMELLPCFCWRPFDIWAVRHMERDKGQRNPIDRIDPRQIQISCNQIPIQTHCWATCHAEPLFSKKSLVTTTDKKSHKISRTLNFNWIQCRRTLRCAEWAGELCIEKFVEESAQNSLRQQIEFFWFWECLKSLVMKGAEEMSSGANK